MADCTIVTPMSLDLVKIIADVAANDSVLAENSFMATIDLPVDITSFLPGEYQAEIIQPNPILLSEDRLIKTGLQQAIKIVFGEKDTIQIPKELDLEVDMDPVIGLSDGHLPSQPVIKVLSKELSAEDFKLYVLPSIPEKQDAEITVAGKSEKIIYTPAIQTQSKPEDVPKFLETIQQLVVKETNAVESIKLDIMQKPQEVEKNNKIKLPENNNTINTEDFIEELESSPDLKLNEKIIPRQVLDKPQVEKNTDEVKNKTSTTIVLEAPAAASLSSSVSRAESIANTSQQVTVKAPQVIQDVVVQLKKAFDQNLDKVTIQVNPPSLGKIEVELNFSNDGRVNAILLADKVETYDLLKQNPQLLKEALSGQGINAETTDLSFNLRGEQGETSDNSPKHRPLHKIMTKSESVTESENYRQAPNNSSNKKVDIHA